MINLKISGRGGNQFFQYAYVQKYIDENFPNETMNISFEYLKEKKTDNVSFVNVLKQFNIKNVNIIKKVDFSFKQKILDFCYKSLVKLVRINAKLKNRGLMKKDYLFIKKILQKTMNKNGLYYYIPEMDNFYKSENKNIIFFGSYEDSKKMIDYKEEILKYYKVDTELNKDAQKLYDLATETNSICVTIRRGDFLMNQYRKNYYICDKNYFDKAVFKMNNLIKNPQYIVFSDDIEWCKKNLNFPQNTLYENEGNTISQKIKLMSQCKNFIISNSTFSWWVQFLSINPNKKVIAPKIWNRFEYCNPIYMDDWILL